MAKFEAELYHLDYTEKARHRTLDEVYSFVPGVQISIRKSIQHIVLEPSLAFRRGDLTYRGGTGESPFLTLLMDTENYLFDANLLIGWLLEYHHQQNLIPYVKYGYRRWLREVPPVAFVRINGTITDIGINSYTETYQNQYLMLGLEYQKAVNDFALVALFASAGTTFDATLFTNSPSIFRQAKTLGFHYDLGNKPIYEVGIKTDFKWTETWHTNFNITYRDFAFGKSPPKIFSLEPNSTTQSVTIGLGISASIV